MLVEFKHAWFSPTDEITKDKIQKISGTLYKKGVHEIPENLRERLPKSAKILEKKPEVVVEKESNDLKDYDTERSAADHFVKIAEEAEKTLTERRREIMAKAREVKKLKELASTPIKAEEVKEE